MYYVNCKKKNCHISKIEYEFKKYSPMHSSVDLAKFLYFIIKKSPFIVSYGIPICLDKIYTHTRRQLLELKFEFNCLFAKQH